MADLPPTRAEVDEIVKRLEAAEKRILSLEARPVPAPAPAAPEAPKTRKWGGLLGAAVLGLGVALLAGCKGGPEIDLTAQYCHDGNCFGGGVKIVPVPIPMMAPPPPGSTVPVPVPVPMSALEGGK